MTVTRDDIVLEPVAVMDGRAYNGCDFYIVKPGDIITVDNANEAKSGGVKAGYDILSECVNTDGEETHPLDTTYATLPDTYTVGENDILIAVYEKV